MAKARKKPAKRTADPPAQHAEPAVRPVEGDSAALLDTLVTAVTTLDDVNRLCAAMSTLTAPPLGLAAPPLSDELPIAPLDAVARALPFTEPLAAPLRAAAGALAAWAVSDEGGTSAAEITAPREALHAADAAVRDAVPVALPPVPRSRRKAQRADVLGRIAALIREAGLGAANTEILLATERGGREVLLAARIPPETAHVWLLESLYQRVELAVLGHELLALERMASRWQFRRWGGDERLRVRSDAFGRMVREQEYSLVERPTLAFDLSVVVALQGQPLFGEIPAVQQRLARALAGSFAGVFTVRRRGEGALELEDAATGRRYAVHEHNPEIGYEAGFVALGRLIPLEAPEGGDTMRWLRSPGMAFLAPTDAEMAASFARGVEMMKDQLEPTLALEAIIATLMASRRPELPRAIEPAVSRAEANALLFDLNAALRDAGLARQVAKRRAPAELRAMGPGAQFFEYTLDRDVGEWMGALSEQAGSLPR